MALALCQCLGFFLAAIGVAGITAATVMNQWSTQDLYNNPVTETFNFQGLWQSCIRDSSGYTECRSYFTILGLPGKLPADMLTSDFLTENTGVWKNCLGCIDGNVPNVQFII